MLFISNLIETVAPFAHGNVACHQLKPLFFHTKQHPCAITLHRVILANKLDLHFTFKKGKVTTITATLARLVDDLILSSQTSPYLHAV